MDRVAISAMQRLQEAVLDVLADKGLQLLAPDQYEPFDPQRHDSHDRDIVWTNEEAHHNQVEQIIWPGLEGSGVIKKARVRRFLDIKRERG